MNDQVLVLQSLGVDDQMIQRWSQQAGLLLDWIREDDQRKVDQKKIIALVTVNRPIDRSLLDQYPHVKVVAVAFTGVDHVDLDECHRRNIAVYNVPAYSTDSVAELALGMTLSLLRHLPSSHQSMKEGKWQPTTGIELSEKTVGICGTGAIGLKTATLFKAFGCKLLGWSRHQKQAFVQLGGVYESDLISLCQKVDILSIHVALNQDTHHLIDKAALESMKSSAYLINTARGGVINQPALIQALKNHSIAGAGLDVFEEEPLDKAHPLRKLPNVVLAPHIAYNTKEALLRRAKVTIDNVAGFLSDEDKNRVV